MIKRCDWCEGTFEKYIQYHDEEWGVPQHEEGILFEFLVLESAQAGLSWATILKKREGYRQAFEGFDPNIVSQFTEEKVHELLLDQSIIRNRAKIESAINNAKCFLEVQEEFGSFDTYCWGFVGGSPIVNGWKTAAEVPATTKESDAFSKDLKTRGFKFLGSTTVYAFMQAIGMVNDHTTDCYRYQELTKMI